MVRIVIGIILAISGIITQFIEEATLGDTIINILCSLIGIALVVWGILDIKGLIPVSETKTTPASSTSPSSDKPTCKSCRWYKTDVDLPHPVCTYHQFHFEQDFSTCDDYEKG